MSLKVIDNKENWTCPYPDHEGNFIRCDHRGGIPTVEPGSTRSASCLPCKVGKIAHSLIDLSGLIKIFNEIVKSTL